MNGVRRFLGAGAVSSPSNEPPASPPSTTLPLADLRKTSWPASPRSGQGQSSNPSNSPQTTVSALSIRKDRQHQPFTVPSDDRVSRTPSPSTRSGVNRSPYTPSPVARASASLKDSRTNTPVDDSPQARLHSRLLPENDRSRGSTIYNTRNELLISLLASEAVVDSRECQILSSEEVEELKKEQEILFLRLEAASRKLTLETKMREASLSLSKVNAPNKDVSKQSEEEINASDQTVQAAQMEFWRVSERANSVQKKLLEHRAGVLSMSVRSMEKKMARNSGSINGGDSGYNTPNHNVPLSPTASSVTSASSLPKPKFDGAHFFAGHADSVVPQRRRTILATDLAALEEKLKAAADALAAANQKTGDMARELSLIRLEKEQIETTMGMELQSAEDTISALETELRKLEILKQHLSASREERNVWERDRAALAERTTELEMLERRLKILEEQRDTESGQTEQLQRDLTGLKSVHDEGVRTLQKLTHKHRISQLSPETSLLTLTSSIASHLSGLMAKIEGHDMLHQEWDTSRRKLEEDIRVGIDKWEALFREMGEVRRESDEAGREKDMLRKETDRARRQMDELECLSDHLRRERDELKQENDQARREMDRVKQENAQLQQEKDEMGRERDEPRTELQSTEILTKEQALKSSFSGPLSLNPDLENEPSKWMSILLPIWNNLPSAESRVGKFSVRPNLRSNSPTGLGESKTVSSIAELDVRSLKTLYDANRVTHPPSPNLSPFSIEAFAQRVQALIVDDKALIERLIRFAQAHDLLRQNAERAQKLAQESGNALETYQKQVRTLEERNLHLSSRQIALQDEIHQLSEAVERMQREKRGIEARAAEQAETCRQLSQTNDALSAKALRLAEEAAAAPLLVRKQLEECQGNLQRAEEEIHAMQMSESDQRIALLDELNSVQTENSNLRAQLRALKR